MPSPSASHRCLRQLQAARQRARDLGLFVEDRELLECATCGLMEDVLASGELVTYTRREFEASAPGHLIPDSQLRFIKLDQSRWQCPGCGAAINLPEEE